VKQLTVEQICQAIHGRLLADPDLRGQSAGKLICSVSTDSRIPVKAGLFFALKGPTFDGHEYLSAAAEAGCIAAVVSRRAVIPKEACGAFGGAIIAVDDTLEALGMLGRHHRQSSSATVIAVTGSNGKTTVKRMIHHMLSKHFRGSASPKSFNNNIGVPLTLLGASDGDDYVVCEIGTNAPGEIAALSQLAWPDIAVITSVSPTHLEKLGTVEKVAAEKASILDYVSAGGIAVVWADNQALEVQVRRREVKLVRFGLADLADLRLTGYAPAGRRQRFELNGKLWVELGVPGRHNACNALAAIAVAQRMGLELARAAGDLADYAGEDMRLEFIQAGDVSVINDCYNANPASMLAAADVLGDYSAGRKVMVAGDMRELGEGEVVWHVQTGADLAQRGVDLLIGVGRLGRYIAQGAQAAGTPAESYESVEAAQQAIGNLLSKGDVVLVKGSRAMRLERLVETICRLYGADGLTCKSAGKADFRSRKADSA